MAYVKTKLDGSGTNITLNYSANEHDFMFIIDTGLYNTSAMPTGWTALTYNTNTVGSYRNKIWYRRATASEPTSVTITGTGYRHSAQLIICAGVDSTTAFDVTPVSSPNAYLTKLTAQAITPVTDGALILYLNAPNGYGCYAAPGVIECHRSGYGVTGGAANSYYSYGTDALTVVPPHDFYWGNALNSKAALVTIALRDDGTDKRVGYVDSANPPCEVLQALTNSGSSGHLTGTAKVDVSAVVHTIQGRPTTYQSGGGGFEFERGLGGSGFRTSGASTTTPTAVQGSLINTTHDLENALISVSSQGLDSQYLPFGTLAKGFGIGDGTNFRVWRIDASDTLPSGTQAPFAAVIEVEGGYESEVDFGTVSPAVLQAIDHFVMIGPARSTYSNSSFGFCYRLNTMILLGGSNTFPTSMTIGTEVAATSSLRTVSSQSGQSSSQFFSIQKVQVGDGAVQTVWGSNNHALEWPPAPSEADRRIQVQVSPGMLGIGFKASHTCDFDFGNTSFNMGNLHKWELVSGTSTLATYNEVGAVILNAEVILNDIGRAMGGMNFSGCKEFTLNSVDLSGGVTIANGLDPYVATVTTESAFTKLHNCTFNNNNTAIVITGDQTGSWSDPNVTFLGNTFDIEYTGTTDFSIQSALPISVNNSSSGTLTVITPVTSFTINSSESGSLIQIFATGTQTLLASTTGSSLNYVFVGTVAVDYVVQKSEFLQQRFVGVTLTDSSTTVSLIPSREYIAHGLTYTTDASWSRSLNQLTVPSWGVSGQKVFSLMLDSFITEATLFNTAFNIEMDGANSLFLTNGAEGATDTSIENLIECGCAYLDSSGGTTTQWTGVKSVGNAAGFTGEYQQQDGVGTTDARVSGVFNELVKVYGDVTHGNFDYTGHLVLKYQPNTYRESRSDVLSDYGILVLAPTLYIVAMEPQAIGITAGDPAISITIIDHTGSPLVVGGKSFDYEIQDNGANTAEAILRELNYNLSQDTVYEGKDPFNWPEMVLKTGANFETTHGIVEGTLGLHGVYVSRASSDHPDFTRHQSNDGTYYVKPITANASISNIVSGSRLRIYNETTATETYNDFPGASFSDSYTEGTTYTDGDVITVYISQTSGVTAQLPFTATVVAGSSGWTILAAQVDDTVYNQYGLNGSTITKFTADYVFDEVDLAVAANFAGNELYSWWAYNLTTSQGISDFFGGIVAQDAANLLVINTVVNIFLDNTTSTNVYQTDNIRIYRADGSYPVKNPTSGGGGIDVVWRDRVYLAETGVSGLTPTESSQLSEISSVNAKIGTPVVTVSGDIGSLNDFDPASDTVATVAVNLDMRGTDGANTTSPDNAGIAAIKAKTDQLTFTKTGEMDANIQSVNDSTVSGSGTTGDPWGPE